MHLSVDKLRESAGGVLYTVFPQRRLGHSSHTSTNTCFSFDIVIGASECD